MTFNAAKAIKNEGVSFPFEFAAEVGDFTLGEELIRIAGDVNIRGAYTGMGSYIKVEAELGACFMLECGRCLKPYELDMKLSTVEEYSRFEDPSHPDRYLFDGDEFNLSQLIEDNLIMALPIQRLCHESCKGLCPVCGKNLNEEKCVCVSDSENHMPEWKEALLAALPYKDAD